MKKLFVFGFVIFSSYLMTSCISIETEEQKEQKEAQRKEDLQSEIEEDLAEASKSNDRVSQDYFIRNRMVRRKVPKVQYIITFILA